MTAHPETRYRCDRCGTEAIAPVSNAPPHARMAGPLDWLMIRIGDDPSMVPQHFCHACKEAFIAFMEEGKR